MKISVRPSMFTDSDGLPTSIVVEPDRAAKQPRTWEQAAQDALWYINTSREDDLACFEQRLDLGLIERILADMKSAANSDTYNLSELVDQMVHIGQLARPHVDLDDAEIVQILAEKQAAYGVGNILAFRETGLHVRMSDKVARLRNIMDKNRTTDWEPLADTWLDLVGYATIAVMLHNNDFEHPLERDVPSTPETIDQACDELRVQLTRLLGGSA